MTDPLEEWKKELLYSRSIDPGIFNYMYVKSNTFKIKKFFHLLNEDDKTKEKMVEKWDEYGRRKLNRIKKNAD